MALPIIGAVLGLGEKLIDKLIPDPKLKSEAMLKLAEMEQTGELARMSAEVKLAEGQMEINKIEAASPDRFIAGWRPAVGWVCAAGLGMAYIAGPAVSLIISLVGVFHGVPFVAPVVDMASLSPILMGMLGMASLRTWEKVKGAEGNR